MLTASLACSSSNGAGNPGTGGASETGGATSSGGTVLTGGMTSGGGASDTGGATSAGGATARGGTSGSGGITSTGGRTASGGTSGSGGIASTGDAGLRDGATGSGGSTDGGTLANPAPGSKLFLGVNFWRIDWMGADQFFKTGVNFATVTNPWRDDLITDLAPFHAIRYMDWNLANVSPNPQANWDTRPKKTDNQNKDPIAYEWQIDLCNRAKTDCWFTYPSEANLDSYATNLAQLFYSQLDPSLRVYVEWSNEVWNSSLGPQQAYAAQQAKSLGLPGSSGWAAYQAYASVRVFEKFEAVFGKGNPRLVKVISAQQAWEGPCVDIMAAVHNAKVNPNGTMPDVIAVAPYFQGDSISSAQSDIAGQTDGIQANITKCANADHLPLIGYEGGADLYAATNCAALSVSAPMHDVYTSFLDMLNTSGMTGPFMHYTLNGDCWGLKQNTGDTLDKAPKYKGVTDWLAAHP